MINSIKKYLNFIFRFDLTYENKTFKSYNSDIKFNLSCQMDPLIFLENYFDDDDILKKTKLKFNPSQLYFIDSVVNKQKLITLAKNYSEIEDAQLLLVLWLLIFYPGHKVGIICPTTIEAQRYMKGLILILKRIKPEYKIKLIESTTRSITFSNGSHCSVRVSKDHDIDGYFRGITLNTLILNEASRIKHIREVYDHFTKVYDLENIIVLDINHNLDIDTTKDGVKWFFGLYGDKTLYDIEIK